jgi:starch synthase (maltosyl-transferring)
MDPADARKITVWGDMAEIDNFYSDDRESLWNYWGQLSLFYARLGFGGFRCDAAYQVPVELWKRLIKKIKSLYPDFIFVAETLGCKEKDLLALAEAGFDYLYNSSKWWDFKAEWCLRQYNESRLYAPSIAFPETHDSARLAEETGADINYLKMRYLFAATFSKGLLVPIGFEFGFKRKMNVVKTSPEWWEASNFDLTDFIRQVNNFKKKYQIFNADNPTFQLECLKDEPICGLIKISPASGEKAILLINPQQTKSQPVRLPNLPEIFQASGPFQIISPQEAPVSIGQSFETSLNPSEIKIIYSKMGTDPNF